MADLGLGGAIAVGLGTFPKRFTLATGRLALILAVIRRLRTPHGFYGTPDLNFAPNEGYSLDDLLSCDFTRAEIAGQAARIRQEVLREERMLAAQVDIKRGAGGVAQIMIGLADADGPFTLVLAVGQVTFEILQVT